AAIGAAIGAAFAGSLGVTTTSGPGMALKSEFMGLAIMVELPLVIVNMQRGGPSTGLPTKTEQADLLQALFGRPSEAPLIVLAAKSPADCFETAFEACRLSVRHMTPVILLSDGFIANGSEPWKLPRPWAIPGTPGLEHRVGGLQKADGTGNVSYDPANHDRMVRLRAEKVARVARDIPPAVPEGE